MTLLIIGLILFHGLHALRFLAPNIRAAGVARLGEGPWKGVYSLLTILAVVIIVFGYGSFKATAPILWNAPYWLHHVTVLAMLPAFVLIPFNKNSGRFGKNPFLIAVLIWAFFHILVNGDLASILLFGSFFVWGKWYILKTRGEDTRLPTAPLARDLIGMGIGAILWAVFVFWAHEWLFGVAPLG